MKKQTLFLLLLLGSSIKIFGGTKFSKSKENNNVNEEKSHSLNPDFFTIIRNQKFRHITPLIAQKFDFPWLFEEWFIPRAIIYPKNKAPQLTETLTGFPSSIEIKSKPLEGDEEKIMYIPARYQLSSNTLKFLLDEAPNNLEFMMLVNFFEKHPRNDIPKEFQDIYKMLPKDLKKGLKKYRANPWPENPLLN